MSRWKGEVEHTRKGNLGRRKAWDATASRELGLLAHAAITKRAFDDGRGSDDRPHRAYSTTPLWVSNKAFPRPRGGRKTKAGRFYEGGYRQFKALTQGVSKVDLTRTGRMRRVFRLKRATKAQVVLGLTGRPAVYGTFVNRKRPWMTLSDNDRAVLRRALERIIRGAVRRSD